MIKLIRLSFMLLLISFSLPGRADILVLIHGYLGDAGSWERSGINTILDNHGWKRAGLFIGSPVGPQLLVHAQTSQARNQVYVVNLPSETPVPVQAGILAQMLDRIRQLHPHEPLILAGHSAGGVVARAALVLYPQKNVIALITIASPHLGTGRALQALNITENDGPFELVKDFIGGNDYQALRHSRALMHELLPVYPGSFLDWLNTRKHPDIKYISVVRTNPAGIPGDILVPGYSENMNNIPALQGKSSVIFTPSSHYLNYDDGFTLLNILKSIEKSKKKK